MLRLSDLEEDRELQSPILGKPGKAYREEESRGTGRTRAHPAGAGQDPTAEAKPSVSVPKGPMVPLPSLLSCWVSSSNVDFYVQSLSPLDSLGSMMPHKSWAVFIINNKIQLILGVLKKCGIGEGKP